ncbi:MAG: TolC family protein [Syntrophobacteraceae bacterium]
MKGFIAWLCFILAGIQPGVCSAGEAPSGLGPEPLTMSRAVEYGLQHNRTLRSAKQDVLAVDQQVRQVRAGFLPKVDSRYAFRHLDSQPFAKADITGGGSVEFATGHKNTNRWEVELSQPLFAGFGITAQHKSAKKDLKIAGLKEEQTKLDVIRNIQRSFLQVLLAEKLHEVTRENLASLEIQRKNAQASFEQGLTAQNDVLKADVAVAQARQRERAAAKDLSLLRSQLNQLLDIDLKQALVLSEQEIHLQLTPGMDELNTIAERQRPEYLSLNESILQTQDGITGARSRYYPQVSAFAQYYREGNDILANNNDFTNSNNTAVGVRMDWNLFEGGKTDASIKELRYRQSALEELRRDLKQQIALQVEDAYEQLQVARANIETAQAALKQAEENQRMTTLQYREQLVIFLEVLNAQVFVAQTKADYYQALYGYQLAWVDLERAVGGPVSGDMKQ